MGKWRHSGQVMLVLCQKWLVDWLWGFGWASVWIAIVEVEDGDSGVGLGWMVSGLVVDSFGQCQVMMVCGKWMSAVSLVVSQWIGGVKNVDTGWEWSG